MPTMNADDEFWNRLTKKMAERAPDAFDGLELPIKITHKTSDGEEFVIYEKEGNHYVPDEDAGAGADE